MTAFLRPVAILLTWLILWVAAWRLFYGPLSSRRINYVDKFVLTSAYFLCLTALAAVIFMTTLLPLADTFTGTSVTILAMMIALQPVLYFVSRQYLRKPQKVIARHPQEFFLTLDYRYLFSKAFEVLFQQTMIVALVLTIHRETESLLYVILIYTVVFSIAHIPLMNLFGDQAKSFARFYVVAAIVSGLVFPPLILKVDGGFVYAYVIHSFFYTLLAVVFWVKHTLAQSD